MYLLQKGSMIKIEVAWNCDYDFYWRKCLPSYNFKVISYLNMLS